MHLCKPSWGEIRRKPSRVCGMCLNRRVCDCCTGTALANAYYSCSYEHTGTHVPVPLTRGATDGKHQEAAQHRHQCGAAAARLLPHGFEYELATAALVDLRFSTAEYLQLY